MSDFCPCCGDDADADEEQARLLWERESSLREAGVTDDQVERLRELMSVPS